MTSEISKFLDSNGMQLEHWLAAPKGNAMAMVVVRATAQRLLVRIRLQSAMAGAVRLDPVSVPPTNRVIVNDQDVAEDVAMLQLATVSGTNVHDTLESMYDGRVDVADPREIEDTALFESAKQLRRLARCVDGTVYGLAILSRPENSRSSILVVAQPIEGFVTSTKIAARGALMILPVIKFSTLYNRIATVGDDLSRIMQRVHATLNTTFDAHKRHIEALLVRYSEVLGDQPRLLDAKTRLREFVSKYEDLLEEWTRRGAELRARKIADGETTTTGMHAMIAGIRGADIDAQLAECAKSRADIYALLTRVRDRYDRLALDIDRALFDSAAMLMQILNGFERLRILETIVFSSAEDD